MQASHRNHQGYVEAPKWAEKLITESVAPALETFSKTEFESVESGSFELPNVFGTVVFKQNGDVVFQLFGTETEKFQEFADRDFVAQTVEDHYGSTDQFQASYIPDIKSWAVNAPGLRERVGYNPDHHLSGFLKRFDANLAAK